MYKITATLRSVLVALLLVGAGPLVTPEVQAQATKVKKVLFQGFWWDYENDNFPNRWSNYLTELTPRLKAVGIDAVWIPPSYKNGFTGSVGYSPFDHYDLGDKYQKGGSDSLTVRTRMGNKDELLRLIAVMHANGMEVLQDVVLNHVDQAGTNVGLGGQDPEPTYSMQNSSGYKNFRYVSYGTPMLDESQNDYWTRNGRWPKNYANFYPYPGNFCTTGDICSPFFGPDMAYDDGAFGQSTNIPTSGSATIGAVTRPYVNPPQATRHMRNNARDWIMWFKRQTGVDGWRWDAVKHFPIYMQEDLIYNTKYVEPPFAQGGEAMFNIGEWIGSKAELDAYVTNVRSGTEEHTGTFDFSLRGYSNSGGLYSMVHGFDGYNMQNLPNEQQDKRYYDYASQRVHRTCPFVNSHDTYRPILDPVTGNFSQALGVASGWNTGQELGGNGQHIDPREPRLSAAYATTFAMDGNPTVFFEDLFDIGTTSKRFTHLPTNAADLPMRPDIVNIVQAHQKLQFKNGDYYVPTSPFLTGTMVPFYQTGNSGDHLVIERRGRAIIGISDKFSTVANNSADQEVYVSVNDPAWHGLNLYDYSGAHGVTTTPVFNDGRVLIKTAPVGHTIAGARGHGYSIWAPAPAGVVFNTVEDMYNYLATYAPGRATNTVQEWEMSDDLGDSHPLSLQQGGRMPDYSTAQRTAGRIYVQAGKRFTFKVTPTVNRRFYIDFYRPDGSVEAQASGSATPVAPLAGSFVASTTGWLLVRVRNFNALQPGQVVRVNITYTAPTTVNTRTAPGNQYSEPELITDRDLPVEAMLAEATLELSPNPTSGRVYFQTQGISDQEILRIELFDLRGQLLFSEKGNLSDLSSGFNTQFGRLSAGTYFLTAYLPGQRQQLKLVKL